MKKLILALGLIISTANLFAQKLTTTSAVVGFDATTPIDKLPRADNKTVIGSLDKKTGTVMFEAAVSNFAFSNPSMQTHFNSERWMNSTAFPKISFSGKLDKLTSVKFTKDGTYKTTATGNLTIKGITKKVTAPVKLIVKAGEITSTSSFNVTLADYNISGQQVESGKVARVAKVTVSAGF